MILFGRLMPGDVAPVGKLSIRRFSPTVRVTRISILADRLISKGRALCPAFFVPGNLSMRSVWLFLAGGIFTPEDKLEESNNGEEQKGRTAQAVRFFPLADKQNVISGFYPHRCQQF